MVMEEYKWILQFGESSYAIMVVLSCAVRVGV